MKPILCFALICIGCFSCISCENKKEREEGSKSKTRNSERHKQTSSEKQKNNEGEKAPDKSAQEDQSGSQRSMPQHLQEAFDGIKKGEPKLVAFKKAWDASWDKTMSEKLTSDDKVASGLLLSGEIKTFQENVPESTFALLRAGENLDGFERSHAIVYSSILAGLALDRDTANSIPLILNKYANTLPPVKGDVLLSKVAMDTSGLLEPVGDFSEGDFFEWKKLAGAKNPAYRMIALRFFGRLCSEQDKEKEFYELYLKETDPEIGVLLMDEVMKAPVDIRKEILTGFEREQKNIGNDEIAELAGDKIEGD